MHPNGFRPAAEAEVVLTFLRGEAGSARFGNDVRQALTDAGGLLRCDAWAAATKRDRSSTMLPRGTCGG